MSMRCDAMRDVRVNRKGGGVGGGDTGSGSGRLQMAGHKNVCHRWHKVRKGQSKKREKNEANRNRSENGNKRNIDREKSVAVAESGRGTLEHI